MISFLIDKKSLPWLTFMDQVKKDKNMKNLVIQDRKHNKQIYIMRFKQNIDPSLREVYDYVINLKST